MTRTGAAKVIKREVAVLKAESYNSLRKLIGHPMTKSIRDPDGTTYNIEIVAVWDDKPEGTVRVMVSADAGGWRAFVPVTESFTVDPE